MYAGSIYGCIGRDLSCSTGATVNTMELYIRSRDVESSGAVEVFEWTAGVPIKQTVSGKICCYVFFVNSLCT